MVEPNDPRLPPAFSPEGLVRLFREDRHVELSEAILATLHHFRDRTYHQLEAQGQSFVDVFVQVFLSLFATPGYYLRRDHLLEFARLNATISNVVAMSRFGTTDEALARLAVDPAGWAKAVVLCSARNRQRVDVRGLFDLDPELAWVWYGAFAQTFNSGLIEERVAENLREHFRQADDRLDVGLAPLDAYFASTYCGGDCDRVVKSAMNRAVRREAAFRGLSARNRPDPRRIAVVSGNWSADHSVYRISRAFVEALSDYHLTLVRFGRKPGGEIELFDEVVTLGTDSRGRLDVSPLLDNSFGLAYFPDVGLTEESVLLANLRLAPVQVASMGHSVSSFGSEVDYWISGVEAESTDHPERFYSERLVLLPGSGAVHERPAVMPGRFHRSDDEILLNCPWNAQKLNAGFVGTLRKILARTSRPVRLRIYVNRSLDRRNDLVPFVRELERLLGRNCVEVKRGLSYPDYMAEMAAGDFTIDSHPFGGCNTVADSLHLRRLTVTYESDRWYGRIGSQMVRSAGLPELATGSEEEYVETVLRLIHDEQFRAGLQERLDQVDLDATVFRRDEAGYFARAIAYLIDNHERLRSEDGRAPIRIER
ncbi:MAG: hypothetical protein U0835_14330 [Isosphaeraceae bacterium]